MPNIDDFIRAQAKKLRETDEAPKNRDEWKSRKELLREKMFAAMGGIPDKACDLEPRIVGTLKRDGYTIEKLVFQSRPNVWVTATAYVPLARRASEGPEAKVPAVLCVHGHWAGARRDPVVQSRCVGLVKLGFFVLVVDAFGSGERFTKPANGTYHGALYGATLWPSGHSLLGMQVYDNRRAVDYILGRPEVNGKLGVTGASGGGNQSMYAGALDERFSAVVPVCSVGNYQAYLKAACCVCEVLPGALQSTEEGDVLGLVAPRALLVISASKDAFQFSPAEAAKSIDRAKQIFKLHDDDPKLKHQIFESPHAYNQAMREAMYGWMTLHLKGEGKGEPIPEPKLTIEKPEDLACFPDPNDRPKGFLTPPLFAYAVGKELVAKADKLVPDHKEMWEATAAGMRKELRRQIGPIPELPKDLGEDQVGTVKGKITQLKFTIKPAPGITLEGSGYAELDNPNKNANAQGLFLKFDGDVKDIDDFAATGFLQRLYVRNQCKLRGTGQARPMSDAIGGAPDHNSAEHALWIGSPLLYQWVVDIRVAVTFLRQAQGKSPFVLVGIWPLAIPSIIASALFPELIDATILIDPPVSYLSDTGYAAGTPMGILAPGILKVGDIPHLASLIAPRRLIISGVVAMNGKKLTEKELQEAFAFTSKVYGAMKVPEKLTITTEAKWDKIEL